MIKELWKYMRYGKKVSYKEDAYYLVEDMRDSKDGYVSAVLTKNYNTYEMRQAWIRNKVHPEKVDEYKAVIKSLTARIPCELTEPLNEIRFITPDYEELFRIKDLGYVQVDGETRQVCYIDDCHFCFVGGSIFHICEFAEICQHNGTAVKPCT